MCCTRNHGLVFIAYKRSRSKMATLGDKLLEKEVK